MQYKYTVLLSCCLAVVRHKLFYRVLLHAFCINTFDLKLSNCPIKNHFTIFGQLIVRKIIKIVATRCHVLKIKCSKNVFRFELRPKPRGVGGRGYSAPPDPLAGIKETYF